MEVRLAKFDELSRVSELRKQVNDVHVKGKPEAFKPGFSDELKNYIFDIWDNPREEIVVAIKDGVICGYAVLNHIHRDENPFMPERDFLDIDEFCVDEAYRRQGVATALVEYIKEFAKERGHKRIELNMWEFNEGALAFYEAAGFKTFRRYMEMFV